ncbi:MAG: adenylate cyclase [Myxococcota bacterium]
MSSLPIVRAYFATRMRRFRDRAALEAWQDQQVCAHLERVVPRSRWLQERLAGRPVGEWRAMEPVGKAEMMARFTDLNTVGLTLEDAMRVALAAEDSRDFAPELNGVTVGLSSGTSGHRGLFVVPPAERQEWAGHMLARLLPHPLLWPRRDRVAFFLRANSNLYETTRSARVRFEYFDLIEELDAQESRLRELDPTILVAPPSTLRRLARRRLAGSLVLSPIKVIAVAEVLDPLDERLIRRAFGQTVHQVYQATEGFLGHTCTYGTLHLAEDVMAVEREPLDDQRFVPVITDFRRSAQPIVRYRLNDVLRLRPVPCRCGSPLTALAAVEGRDDDVFVGIRADGTERPVFADFIRRAVLTAHADVADYGVRQVAPDALEVFVEVVDGADPERVRAAVGAGLAAMFARLGCREPAVTGIASWPEGGMRKRKRVERGFAWTER